MKSSPEIITKWDSTMSHCFIPTFTYLHSVKQETDGLDYDCVSYIENDNFSIRKLKLVWFYLNTRQRVSLHNYILIINDTVHKHMLGPKTTLPMFITLDLIFIVKYFLSVFKWTWISYLYSITHISTLIYTAQCFVVSVCFFVFNVQ